MIVVLDFLTQVRGREHVRRSGIGGEGECQGAGGGGGSYKTISREYIFSIILLLFTSIYYFSISKDGGR